MMQRPIAARRQQARSRLGWSWCALWAALALHVADEALTNFLSVYNPTVLALRRQLGFWPMPTFEFNDWLTGLTILVLVLAALSPLAFRNAGWFRPLFYFVTIVAGVINSLGHITATIFGQTVGSVRFARPAPGFYSSPVLLAAALYALAQLRHTKDVAPDL
jgi:hypothetical protein